MILFVVALLYASIIIFDFIPNYKKNKTKKAYCVTYIIILVITFSVVCLRTLGISLITTYDIIHLFNG